MVAADLSCPFAKFKHVKREEQDRTNGYTIQDSVARMPLKYQEHGRAV